MYPQNNNDDDFADFEAALKSLHPRAPSPDFVDRATVEPVLRSLTPGAPTEDFADRVITEGRLREVAPRRPSEGFADRVVAASVSVPAARRNILRFPGALVPFAAAAALALAFAPALLREKPATVAVVETTPVRVDPSAPTVVAEAAPEFPDEALHLPVINLPDGSAYRPVLRRQASAPEEFRAMPGGAVMPVSFTPSSGLDYEPVVFE